MKILSNMRLGKKIALITVTMVVLLTCTLSMALWSMGRIKSSQDEVRAQAVRTSETQETQARIARTVMYLATVLMHQESAEARKCNTCHELRDKSRLLARVEKE